MGDQRFDAAEARGESKQARALGDGARGVAVAADLERDHAASAAHLTLGDRVARVVGQPGVKDALDTGVPAQEAGNRQRIGLMAVHAHRQRLQAA